jgi:hypothetical protein
VTLARGALGVAKDSAGQLRSLNTFSAVYTAMVLAVCRHFPAVGPWRDLDLDELDFFYGALVPELRRKKTSSV